MKEGQLADLALLSADLMAIPEDEIARITSVLTIVGGRVVHGNEEFTSLAPPAPRASPDWSPANVYGGYYRHQAGAAVTARASAGCCATPCGVHAHSHLFARFAEAPGEGDGFWGALGCSCWI